MTRSRLLPLFALSALVASCGSDAPELVPPDAGALAGPTTDGGTVGAENQGHDGAFWVHVPFEGRFEAETGRLVFEWPEGLPDDALT
jgi:hypothetical protein